MTDDNEPAADWKERALAAEAALEDWVSTAIVVHKEMTAQAREAGALAAKLAVAVDALEGISSPTQTLNLLWWQIAAREAIATIGRV